MRPSGGALQIKSKNSYTAALWAKVWISMFTSRKTRALLGFAKAACFLSSNPYGAGGLQSLC